MVLSLPWHRSAVADPQKGKPCRKAKGNRPGGILRLIAPELRMAGSAPSPLFSIATVNL
jgi:hypothetical protein